MDRYISACALAEEIKSLDITVAGKPARWNDAKHTVLRIIAEQPTVDAVEVVRCKECKHMYLRNGLRWCDAWGEINGMGDDGFCNYGERKEKDDG